MTDQELIKELEIRLAQLRQRGSGRVTKQILEKAFQVWLPKPYSYFTKETLENLATEIDASLQSEPEICLSGNSTEAENAELVKELIEKSTTLKEGLELLGERIKRQPLPVWRDVRKAPPTEADASPYSKQVVVLFDTGGIGLQHWGQTIPENDITHWLSIPSLPAATKEEDEFVKWADLKGLPTSRADRYHEQYLPSSKSPNPRSARKETKSHEQTRE